jgi:hypothetical protein
MMRYLGFGVLLGVVGCSANAQTNDSSGDQATAGQQSQPVDLASDPFYQRLFLCTGKRGAMVNEREGDYFGKPAGNGHVRQLTCRYPGPADCTVLIYVQPNEANPNGYWRIVHATATGMTHDWTKSPETVTGVLSLHVTEDGLGHQPYDYSYSFRWTGMEMTVTPPGYSTSDADHSDVLSDGAGVECWGDDPDP